MNISVLQFCLVWFQCRLASFVWNYFLLCSFFYACLVRFTHYQGSVLTSSSKWWWCWWWWWCRSRRKHMLCSEMLFVTLRLSIISSIFLLLMLPCLCMLDPCFRAFLFFVFPLNYVPQWNSSSCVCSWLFRLSHLFLTRFSSCLLPRTWNEKKQTTPARLVLSYFKFVSENRPRTLFSC